MTGLKKRFNGQTCDTIGYNILGLLLDFIWGWPASATLNMICMFSSQPSELQTPAHAHFPEPLAVPLSELWASAALPAKGTDPAPRSAGCWIRCTIVCARRASSAHSGHCVKSQRPPRWETPENRHQGLVCHRGRGGQPGLAHQKDLQRLPTKQGWFHGFFWITTSYLSIFFFFPQNPGLQFWFMWFFCLSGSAYLLQERTENIQMLMFLPVCTNN